MRRSRSTATTVVTVLASLLLGGGSAFAQATNDDVRLVSPAAGDTLKARVTLEVAVDVGPVKRVDLRLTQDGQAIASGSAPTTLPCVEGCEEGGATIWGGRTYDPTLGAPFSPTPQCNGQWMLQPRIDGGAWLQGSPFTLSAPPKAPANVKITVSDDVATITWTPDRSPDVVFHRVERSTGGGPFVVLAEFAGVADRYEDKSLTKGEHIYRVVAARPDGMTNGRPAVPCTDQGAELVASSKNTRLSHTDEGSVTQGPEESGSGSGTSGSGSGSGTSGSGTSGSGQSGSGTSGSGSSGSGTTPTGNGEASPSPEEQGASSPTTTSSPRPTRSPRPVAPPPSATRRTNTNVTAPALGNREEDDGPYYGEGEDFTTEIDYGDAEGIPGEQIVVGYDEAGEPIYETVRVPGEIVAFGVVTLDSQKIRMLAMGLILVALALHGRRWLNAS